MTQPRFDLDNSRTRPFSFAEKKALLIAADWCASALGVKQRQDEILYLKIKIIMRKLFLHVIFTQYKT